MSAAPTRDGLPSVAARQMADEARESSTAAVTIADVLAWGGNNRMKPTGNDAKDLASINRMRALLKLPAFTLLPDRAVPDEPLPPPHEIEPGDAPPKRGPYSMTAVNRPSIQATELVQMPPALVEERPNHVAATSKRLRDILFQELTALRDGKSTPQQAAAVAKIAHQIIAGVRMEMDFAREFPPTIDGSATKLLSD